MAEAGAGGKFKVFISYSRRDSSDFADELLVGLELAGFAPFLDRHDIVAGEDWEARLAGLIQQADTVVFVISPEAVRSERCKWEVDKTVSLSKRLLPVVFKPVPDTEIPKQLGSRHFVRFDTGPGITRPLSQLTEALREDTEWIREHTRLGELAGRWQMRKQSESLLLRGDDLAAAKIWVGKRSADAPQITELQHAFLNASEAAEAARLSKERKQLEEMASAQAARAQALTEREVVVKKLSRRTTVGLITAGTLTAAAAGLAYWGTDAERRFNNERKMVADAEERAIEEAIRKEAMRTDIEGQLVAYAASPGQEASDQGIGGHSPYTGRLLTELSDNRVSLQTACARVNSAVLADTNKRQRPFLSSDLNGEIYLQRQPPDRKRVAIVIGQSRDKITTRNWSNVEGDVDAWSDFLEKRCKFNVVLLKNSGLVTWEQEINKALSFLHPPTKQGGLDQQLVHKTSIGGGKSVEISLQNKLLMFVYAGGGGYVDGKNYLWTDDTDSSSETTVTSTTMPVLQIQESMRRYAAASVLILDTGFDTCFKCR
jgi:hypothetical protein